MPQIYSTASFIFCRHNPEFGPNDGVVYLIRNNRHAFTQITDPPTRLSKRNRMQ
jgi:hypothetical protein